MSCPGHDWGPTPPEIGVLTGVICPGCGSKAIPHQPGDKVIIFICGSTKKFGDIDLLEQSDQCKKDIK